MATYSPEQIPEALARCIEEQSFRPTVVAIAQTPDGLYPMIQARDEPLPAYWFVQGGYELVSAATPERLSVDAATPELSITLLADPLTAQGLRVETEREALARELQQEIGAHLLLDSAPVPLGAVEHPTKARDGFSAGKLLVAYFVPIAFGEDGVVLQPEEVKDCVMCDHSGVIDILRYNKQIKPASQPKADFLLSVMERL